MRYEQAIMSDPSVQQRLMQMQQEQPAASSSSNLEPPKLTRKQTSEIFVDSELEKLKGMVSSQQKATSEQEAMVNMMVINAQIVDAMFQKHKISEEDLNDAVVKYNLMNDPLVKQKMMIASQ